MDGSFSAARELLAIYRAKIAGMAGHGNKPQAPHGIGGEAIPWAPPKKKRKRINKATIRARRNVRKAITKASKRANRQRAA